MDFSDINQMLENLSESDMENLQAMAQSFMGGAQESNAPPTPNISPQMLQQISKIMELMNRQDDSTRFLAALKPHLSESRRKRADEAMQILRIFELMPTLQQMGQGEEGG